MARINLDRIAWEASSRKPLETANTTPIECSHACSRWTDQVTVPRVHPSISVGGLAVRSDTDASGSLVLANSTGSVAPLSHTFATCGRTSPLSANLHARAPSSCLSHYPVKLQRRSCARSGGLVRLGIEAGICDQGSLCRCPLAWTATGTRMHASSWPSSSVHPKVHQSRTISGLLTATLWN